MKLLLLLLPFLASAGDPPKTWNEDTYPKWIQGALSITANPGGEIWNGQDGRPGVHALLVEGAGPKDAGRVCPRFSQLGADARSRFWVAVFRAVSYAESRYDPALFYRETWGGASVGLLQLSTTDADGYGCVWQGKDDLAPQDPRANLECGVKIMAAQLAWCGTLFQGFADSTNCGGKTAHGNGPMFSFYWATLNPLDSSGPQAFDDFRSEWRKMTGWDAQLRKPVAGPNEGLLPECFR
jgi:hypothetical protein